MLLLIPVFIFCGSKSSGTGNVIPGQNFIETDQKLFSKKEFGKLYKWKTDYDTASTVLSRIKIPKGYKRIEDTTNRFGLWLQNLPLKPAGTPVKLFNGGEKGSQDVHFAVLDIDCGTKDLQQCADAVMRLRAEFLYGTGNNSSIHFNYTNGDKIPFSKWAEGYRPVLKANKVNWVKSKPAASNYKTFKDYLWNVFNYAGSKSLSMEMKTVAAFENIKAGDVLIVGGFPGHAMTVIDVAKNEKTGKKIFMLCQSYMPAQDIHIVKNNADNELSPWYEIPADGVIDTPEWTFKTANLMKW
ncbi:MAG: DUF4846 domain-containing protein [Bacteroidia bacterium]|nr:DUF4846 domain-containing protein [Bacteroidia bacterium]